MVLHLAALALLSAPGAGEAQAAEPVDAVEAERAELAHMLRDASETIRLLDDEASALPLLTEVARRAQAIGDTDTLAAALTERSNALELLGDPRGAIEALQEAIPLLCTSALPAHRTQCARRKLNLGHLMASLGDAEAIPQLEEAARQAQADGDHGVEIVALNALGEAFWARDALEDAKRSHQRALDLAIRLNTAHDQSLARLTTHGGQEKSQDKGPQTIHSERGLTERSVIVRAHGAALVGLGRVAMERGDLIQATAQHEAALELLGRLRAEWERGVWPSGEPMERLLGDRAVKDADTAVEALALYELGRVWSLQGRTEEPEAALNRALALFGDALDDHRQADVMMALGALASQRGQVAEAEQLYRKALALNLQARHAHGQMRALIGLGRVLDQHPTQVEAEACFETARPLAVAIGSRSGEASALIGLAAIQATTLGRDHAERTIQGAFEIYLALGMPSEQAWALLRLSTQQQLQGKRDEALQTNEQALEIARRHGLVVLERRALNKIYGLYALDTSSNLDSRPMEAEAASRQLIQLAIQYEDLSREALGHRDLGAALVVQGRLSEAEASFRRSVTIYAGLSPHDYREVFVQLALADVLIAQGKLPEAEQPTRRAVEGLAVAGDRLRQAQALFDLAWLLFELGKTEEAKQALRQSMELAESLAAHRYQVELLLMGAYWMMDEGLLPEAERALRRCLDSAAEIEEVVSYGTALSMLAELLSETGRADEAEALYLEIIARVATPDSVFLEMLFRVDMAEWLISQGRPGDAEAILAPCIDLARSRRRDDMTASCLIAGSDAKTSPRAALRLARRATAHAEDDWTTAEALVNLGQHHHRLDQHRRAERALRRAIPFAESSKFASVEAEALLSLAEVLEARGEIEEAAALRETAAALEE